MNAPATEKEALKRTLVGRVVSDKMNKTPGQAPPLRQDCGQVQEIPRPHRR